MRSTPATGSSLSSQSRTKTKAFTNVRSIRIPIKLSSFTSQLWVSIESSGHTVRKSLQKRLKIRMTTLNLIGLGEYNFFRFRIEIFRRNLQYQV